MGFSVYLQQGRKIVRIKDMKGNDTIENLIKKLKEKINSNKLILCIFEGNPLEPNKTLDYYKIKKHSYIQYSEKYKGGNYFLKINKL